MASTAKLNPRVAAQLARTPAIAVEAARIAMEAGADVIVANMKADAPVRARGGGKLRDSIGWSWGDAPAGSLVIGEVRSGSNVGLQYAQLRITFYAGSRVAGGGGAFYAGWVEFGTNPHEQPKMGRTHSGTRAQPFFFPNWRDYKAKYLRDIKTAVRAAIRKEFNGG